MRQRRAEVTTIGNEDKRPILGVNKSRMEGRLGKVEWLPGGGGLGKVRESTERGLQQSSPIIVIFFMKTRFRINRRRVGL